MITIVGEPGIGKTRLARELASRAGESTTCCCPLCPVRRGSHVPPAPRCAPPRAVDGRLRARPMPSSSRTDLRGSPAAKMQPHSASRTGRCAVCSRVLAPALLILDDVHWAEPALLDLVDYLGWLVVRRPSCSLGLSRPGARAAARRGSPARPAGPTSARGRVVDAGAGRASTRDRIVELAEGNALYVEQLAVVRG